MLAPPDVEPAPSDPDEEVMMTRVTPSWLAPAVASLAVALVIARAGPAEEAPAAEEPQPVAESQAAPEFRLASLDGEEIAPQDYAGEIVIIDFWATWCGPCHAQADILHQLHEEFGDKGVRFLAVSLGESEEVVREFIEKRPYPYPVLLDPEDSLSLDLGIYVLPTIMVIDREGQVAYLEPGVSTAETLRRVLYEAGVEHPATA